MSNNLIQPALSSGELSPNLHARVDLERYQTGLALCRNFFVDFRGGATYRPGTRLVGVLQNSNAQGRLVRFAFNTNQNYILEFSEQVVRFIKNGEYILSATSKTVTNISNAAQAIATSVGHGFVNTDQIFLSGVSGMTEVNNQTFIVSDVLVNSFKLKYLNGSYVDSSTFGAFAGTAQATKIYEVATPWLSSDIFTLKFAQSADVLTITHPSYDARELKRLGENNWTLTTISFASTIAAPAAPTLGKSSDGKTKYAYVITAVNDKDEESVASTRSVIGNAVNIAATAGSIDMDWPNVAGADHYNVYKANPITGKTILFPLGTQFGYIGQTTESEFVDPNIMPDFTRTPPKQLNPFANANQKPSCVTYYQQRIVFAGSNGFPERMNFSQTGQFKNFDESLPLKDSDAIEATVASLEINRVKYMIAMPGGLLVLTSGATFQVNGGGPSTALTPASITAIPQTYNGCGDVSPLAIDFNVVYVQSQNSLIRSLTYNFYTGSYTPQDVSIFSQHLLNTYSIVDWCWTEEPNRIIWAARSDGRFISLTYLPEQKINGMALQSTQGFVESVASVQESGENVLYMMVLRIINGVVKRFSERMMERDYKYGVDGAWNLDCAIERDLPTPAAILTPAAKTGANILFTATAAVFAANSVGRVLRMGGGIATIITFTDTTHVRATFTRDIQDLLPETDTPLSFLAGAWSMATKIVTVGGLWHLEGMTVKALADGQAYSGLVVTNGSITLPVASSKIVAGLSYVGTLKTLPVDSGQLPTIQGKRKNIHALTIRVVDTRGLEMGSTEATLVPFNLPSWDPGVNEIMTGDQRIVMDPNWQEQGVYYVRQNNPYPATVTSFIPELSVGDTGK